MENFDKLNSKNILPLSASCDDVPSQNKKSLEAMPKRGRFINNLISNAALVGTDGYGIIPLVTQITGYMIIVTATLNSASGRYITIALEQKREEEANQYFNTTLFGSLLLIILLIPLTIYVSIHIKNIIVVPDGLETQTQWLFICTVVAFFLDVIQSSFKVSCFCQNRFDLQNTINIIQHIARVSIVVLFFSILTPQIWQVGLATLISMLLGWGWSIRLWRKLTPALKISFAYFSRKALTSLFSTGGWIAINLIGSLLYLSIDLLVVNRMFGAEPAGRYAAVMQWSILLRSLVGVVATLFGPTILYYYARHDIDGISRYGRQAVKLIGLLMALPIGLICGLSTPLLETWLGPKFTDLAWLMSLMTIHLSVNLAVVPLFAIQTTMNRVRIPAIVTLVMGIANLGLAIFLAGPMGWGLYGVAAAGAIALTAKNLVFTSLYATHILGCRLNTFFTEILTTVFATVGLAAIGKLLVALWDISGWFNLFIAFLAISVVYAVIGYYLLLKREDREQVWRMIPLRKSRLT